MFHVRPEGLMNDRPLVLVLMEAQPDARPGDPVRRLAQVAKPLGRYHGWRWRWALELTPEMAESLTAATDAEQMVKALAEGQAGA